MPVIVADPDKADIPIVRWERQPNIVPWPTRPASVEAQRNARAVGVKLPRGLLPLAAVEAQRVPLTIVAEDDRARRPIDVVVDVPEPKIVWHGDYERARRRTEATSTSNSKESQMAADGQTTAAVVASTTPTR